VKWDVAHADVPCDAGMCTQTIKAGTPYRLMVGRYRYCVDCAYRSTHERPPARELPPPVERDPLPTLKRFTPPAGLDVRALQSGDRDE
jgi:hypothetical protein